MCKVQKKKSIDRYIDIYKKNHCTYTRNGQTGKCLSWYYVETGLSETNGLLCSALKSFVCWRQSEAPTRLKAVSPWKRMSDIPDLLKKLYFNQFGVSVWLLFGWVLSKFLLIRGRNTLEREGGVNKIKGVFGRSDDTFQSSGSFTELSLILSCPLSCTKSFKLRPCVWPYLMHVSVTFRCGQSCDRSFFSFCSNSLVITCTCSYKTGLIMTLM